MYAIAKTVMDTVDELLQQMVATVPHDTTEMCHRIQAVSELRDRLDRALELYRVRTANVLAATAETVEYGERICGLCFGLLPDGGDWALAHVGRLGFVSIHPDGNCPAREMSPVCGAIYGGDGRELLINGEWRVLSCVLPLGHLDEHSSAAMSADVFAWANDYTGPISPAEAAERWRNAIQGSQPGFLKAVGDA